MQIILNINFFTPWAVADNSYCAFSPTGHEYRDKRDQGQTRLYNIFLFASTISWPVHLRAWGAHIHHTSCYSYDCLNIFCYMTIFIMVIIYYDTSVGSPYSVTFLSQLSYDNYYESEERFTGELTAYTRKQFFEVWLDSQCLKCNYMY